ncbi:hypothetical protein BE15_18550 [Sorangium cellulosum]|uniref:Uncharacterized protein n=2 Tax=Polyangiaceae TaxID=49 RepID=A0A150R044_SORCE|nr:hypothetical protein BE15_18550 [Sorangium cellulosum]
MGESFERCAVCEDRELDSREGVPSGDARARTRMARVVIQGRSLSLCRSHAATVAAAMPETFEEMRELFVGLQRGGPPAQGDTSVERRSPIPRRNPEDRRVFPPRPEGRRLGVGRRATDPRE